MEQYKKAKIFKDNTRWYVGFYYLNPNTGRYKRFKEYISSTYITLQQKEKRGREMVAKLNKRLRDGWNPFIDKELSLTNIKDALEFILKHKEATLRGKSVSGYRSVVKTFCQWLKTNELEDIYIEELTYQQAQNFMDSVSIELGLSNRTHKNYLTTLRTLFTALVKREYIIKNPFTKIEILPQQESTIIAYSKEELRTIKGYLLENDPKLWLCCEFIFYCFIRPKEITGLKVKDIDLVKGTITVPGEISKNRKTQTVTIPKPFLESLKGYGFENYPKEYYLIGQNLECSALPIYSTRLAERYRKHMQVLKLNNVMYSFKHTGAGMAVENGVNMWDLKNQLRHHSLDQTQIYLSRFCKIAGEGLINNFPTI